MTNYGYGNLNNINNNNPLLNLLKDYIPQQQTENTQPTTDPQRTNTGGMAAFEINAKSDLEYLKPEKSGCLQMVYCRPEKRVYVGRFSFAREEMDWEAFVSEGEISLSQKNDTSAEMGQIAEALVLVVNKLDSMDSKIQGLNKIEITKEEPIKAESNRKPNGQFKKKGEN